MYYSSIKSWIFVVIGVLLVASCEKEDENPQDKENNKQTSGYYTISKESLDEWDEGIYYHDKDDEDGSYYLISQTDSTDASSLLCLSRAKNSNAEDAVLFHFNDDMTIKDVFIAGYVFEAHSNENDVLFVVYNGDCNIVRNFSVPYKTVSNESRQKTNNSPASSRQAKLNLGRCLDFGEFLNNAGEVIGNTNNLADGKFGDVVLDFVVGRLVGMANLPWYITKLSSEALKKFIQMHYKRIQSHYMGSAEIEITAIKRESETTIRVDGIIKNASSIPTTRITTLGYTHNYVYWGVAMGKWGQPGVYLNDSRTDLTQNYIVQQNDNKFSCTFYLEETPGQVYFFRPFLAPEATIGTDEDMQSTLATCIRYGERKSFLDMEVVLTNFKQTSCKKEGDNYIVKFTVDGSIPDTFNELSNWGFDLKTKSGAYTNRYYAKVTDIYYPPTSKQFECEVKVSRQDIEDYEIERIAPITVTPFIMYWNQLPPMDFLESKEYTLTITDDLCPDNNHPHMIDLGLPSGTKWACCNVDATSPEQYGGYYAWGETQTKKYYGLSNYQHAFVDDNGKRYDQATGQHYSYINFNLNIAGTNYDAATTNWGAPWQMPTFEQFKELIYNTKSEWTSLNGVYGRLFIGPRGSIFLPAAGMMMEDYVPNTDAGTYWSSTLYEGPHWSDGIEYDACIFDFGFKYIYLYYYNYYDTREYGSSIRPVSKN